MDELKKLDPLLHSELRLAIISVLLTLEEADFTFLKEKTGATAGNLSVQIDKLASAGYIEVRRELVGRKTRTTCSITAKGKAALEDYVSTLREYLHV